jgi:ATP-dependent RNA helicase DeaD
MCTGLVAPAVPARPAWLISLVTPREIYQLRVIEKMTGKKITRRPVPTVKEAIEGQQRLAVEKLLQAVEDGSAGNYKDLAMKPAGGK